MADFRVHWDRADDASRIAEVHIAVWEAAHRGIMADEILGLLDRLPDASGLGQLAAINLHPDALRRRTEITHVFDGVSPAAPECMFTIGLN
ncbi:MULTISPECIES: hypothetical protein [Brevibacterium]|uniref:Uncharacterized protein n=1 Tax=Brevibacterium antiquum CNRZ 918 TaxID=1255637 RepID=A0A2H1J107_9MICO|nr:MULTISPECIES: hypothetical protein [Brevibacterium]SMX81147.1 hypothetical protein BANT918_01309 [Brevibacterium antiquum CNRZ 918]HCG56364.1 hypothetical protein [Brevibacterium sp.]